MLSNEQKAKNLKLAYNKTGVLTSDLFNELVALITQSSNVTSSMSAEQIRDALSSLEGLSRLDASAIKNISSSVTVTIGTAEVSLQDIVQQILFDVNQLEDDSHTHANQSVLDVITDAEDGSKFLNDSGDYSLVDWLSISNKPTEFTPEAHTHTVSDISDFPVNVSHFNNNGDGVSPYDTVSSVNGKLALKQDYLGFTPENVANKATDFSVINHTLYPSVKAVKEQLDLIEMTSYNIDGGTSFSILIEQNINGGNS